MRTTIALIITLLLTSYNALSSPFTGNGSVVSLPYAVGNQAAFSEALMILPDLKNSFGVYQVLEGKYDGRFLPVAKIPHPYNADYAYWAALDLKNEDDFSVSYVLHVAPKGTNAARVYIRGADGNFIMLKSGEYVPYAEKDLPKGRDCTVPISFRAGERKKLYIKIRNTDNRPPEFEVKVESTEHFQQRIESRNLFQGIFFGVIFIMFLYNMVIYLFSKDQSFRSFALILPSLSLFFIYYHGFFLETVAKPFPQANSYLFILSGLSMVFYLAFIRQFIQTKNYAPKIDLVLKWLMRGKLCLLAVELSLFSLFSDFALAEQIYTVSFALILLCSSICLALLISLRRNIVLFIIGGAMSMIVAAIIAFSFIYWYDIDYGSDIIQVGILGMVLLFSLGLGYRFQQRDQQRILDQEKLIQQLRESERKRIELNQVLEKKVEARTRKVQEHQQEIALQAKELVEMNWELYEKNDKLYSINNELGGANEKLKAKNTQLKILNEKLNKTLAQLKAAQVQLIQSEKMASVGLLTAGIAHEINNPVNFVFAGSETLESILSDIMDIVDQYAKISPQNSPQEIAAFMADMERLKEELDFDENREDVFALVKDIKIGAKRTAEIVKGLRNFSRLDENDVKEANVHEGLDSTLTLLRNHLKDKIVVQREYDPNMRLIDCYPGQLNQVFMNILVNSIHAIEKSDKKGEGTITIKTAVKVPVLSGLEDEKATKKNATIEIIISDNGIGMNEGVRSHIFDPFYTTKQVGEGTGLGLSISHGIIEKHKGSISVESTLGIGTDFIISLPISQSGN